jgi:sugar phosphate permease
MGFLKNRELLIISFAGTMLGMAQGAFASFFPLYLNEKMGYSLTIAGTLFATVTISGTVGRVFWGIFGDLLFDSNHRPTLSIIAFLTFVSLIVLAFLTKNWPRWLFIVSIIGIGISIWGWNGIILLIVSEISDSSKTGITVGLTATFCWLGISLGPMIFGIITDQFGYFYAWISLSVLIFLSLFLCFFITRSTSYA